MTAKPKRSRPQDVVDFWRQAGPERWFARNESFDANFRSQFLADHYAAARGEHADWLETAEGALALLLLLDQFPRNCFRDTGHAWATDGLALRYALQSLDAGHDQATEATLRPFLYLPFEHAEDAAEQARSVELFAALGDPETLKYALAHQQVITRFGRFPHRNASLGRVNTPDEQSWLDAGGGF
ncbi:Uncharacterized conserved protein, DUF924 family [Pseudoxanthomonas sp. GM95]|uniref:DUF924 family protein n=1 Tax=Pseudoxanthomonas sp. GM95 TaxID=1881043 RepID=UPI0008C63019|nr:DUF924 family protein [Pseudoxanthomonas sp. GM95]SEM36616.1 Uncharacterized conserved protein, DUF924 family [Pseudoxanthomonas sp. GM95]